MSPVVLTESLAISCTPESVNKAFTAVENNQVFTAVNKAVNEAESVKKTQG